MCCEFLRVWLDITSINYCSQNLERLFPEEFKDVQAALKAQSAENVVTGKSKAPAVRSNKQKATVQDEGREAVSFAPSVGLAESVPQSSSSAPKQTNFE